MPECQRRIRKIWEEFENGDTDEASLAKSIDRFEPLLQNISNNGGTWVEFDVPYQKVYNQKKVIKNGSEEIWSYAENLLTKVSNHGFKKDMR